MLPGQRASGHGLPSLTIGKSQAKIREKDKPNVQGKDCASR
jgi:hypothetical protein